MIVKARCPKKSGIKEPLSLISGGLWHSFCF